MKTFLFAALISVSSLSAQSSLDRLMEGNKRYVDGNPICENNGAEKRKDLLLGQSPFAVIIGCSDSRVPPEVVFDQNIGDLFVVRVAGNVVDPVEIDSVEFAASGLKVPLIVVLGHESCAAVKAVLDGTAAENNLENLIPLIQPAIDQSKKLPGNRLENAIKANIRLVIKNLQANSVLSPLIKAGKLTVIGGYYRLESGVVELF